MSERKPAWDRQELHSLLSASATLAGLCITVVTLMNTLGRAQAPVTVVDDMLSACAAAFLVCTYLIFWAMRTRGAGLAPLLTRIADVLFLAALSAMTVAAFIITYTLW